VQSVFLNPLFLSFFFITSCLPKCFAKILFGTGNLIFFSSEWTVIHVPIQSILQVLPGYPGGSHSMTPWWVYYIFKRVPIRSINCAANCRVMSSSSLVAGGSNPYWLISRLLRRLPKKATHFDSNFPEST